MKKCVNCGQTQGIKDYHKYCHNCGCNRFEITTKKIIVGAVKKQKKDFIKDADIDKYII